MQSNASYHWRGLIYLFVYLFICVSVSLSLCLCLCLFVCLSVCLFVCLSVSISSLGLSVYLFICVYLPSICLSTSLSVLLCIFLFVCMFIHFAVIPIYIMSCLTHCFSAYLLPTHMSVNSQDQSWTTRSRKPLSPQKKAPWHDLKARMLLRHTTVWTFATTCLEKTSAGWTSICYIMETTRPRHLCGGLEVTNRKSGIQRRHQLRRVVPTG